MSGGPPAREPHNALLAPDARQVMTTLLAERKALAAKIERLDVMLMGLVATDHGR